MASGWLGLDWGNVPTWVGTVVTSTSVTIAAVSYRRSVRDKERDQASRISAWIGLVEEQGELRRVLRVANGSDASIYEVSVKIPDRPGLLLGEVPGKTTLTPDVKIPTAPESPRRRTVAASLKILGLEVEGKTTSEHVSQEPSPEIEFRDGVGRWWNRSPDGRLKSITERTFSISEVKTRMSLFGFKVEASSGSKGDISKGKTDNAPASGND